VGFQSTVPLSIQSGGEVAVIALRIPPLEPGVGTQRSVGVVELLARGEFLALGVDALVVIDVVLPALEFPHSVSVATFPRHEGLRGGGRRTCLVWF